ncbi:hypothetical protein AAFF_G00115230 [Aldrovandia affinis]|uniref:BMERB domain-containing protein n=1 Tax=Aldrovandia affinis TaxID=143900 RepID=A0AAD7RSY2_9TELE|nr:hypothetical protein AAFF_G00115230 [Aldrovandia affinis]
MVILLLFYLNLPKPESSEMEEAGPPLKPPQNGTTRSSLSILTADVPCSSPPISPNNERILSPKPHNGSRSLDFTNETGPSSTNASMPESNIPTGRSFCIPVKDIQLELQEIEEHLSDLEKQGVEMEKELRQCEAEGAEDIFDTLMVEWFNLIQTKQVYIRRESELVYIAKTQYLEEQQPGVEGELRRLMDKPEHLKTAAEQQQEQELMEKLMEIVNDRNAIVVVLDEDRLREEEEDQQLHQMLENLGKKKEKSKKKSPMKKLFRRISKKDHVKN